MLLVFLSLLHMSLSEDKSTSVPPPAPQRGEGSLVPGYCDEAVRELLSALEPAEEGPDHNVGRLYYGQNDLEMIRLEALVEIQRCDDEEIIRKRNGIFSDEFKRMGSLEEVMQKFNDIRLENHAIVSRFLMGVYDWRKNEPNRIAFDKTWLRQQGGC